MPKVRANGIDISYQERGGGDPLILIMGLGADGSLWEDHVVELEKHFHCYLMDNRGAGDTDKPPGSYTTAEMAEDTAGFMETLGIDSARVAGISMGSAVAQQLAVAHPEKVRSMVLVSSWSRCDAYMKTVFEHFKKARAVLSPADFTQLLQLWIYTPRYYKGHAEELAEGQDTADENPMPQHAFEAQCNACITHDVYDRLQDITQPALITVGEADIFTPIGCSRKMHGRMPNSKIEVFGGWGHCHHWEDLARFNTLAVDFLKEN